jgi:hypothetical protein
MVYLKNKAVSMTEFYIKNKHGEFLPISMSSLFSKDLNGKLVIIRVGTDDYPASTADLDETEESFNEADSLSELDNVSIVITPYQISVTVEDKKELENKDIFLQIQSGNDIKPIEDQLRKMYNKLKKKHSVAVVPVPLKVSEYRKVQEVLKRCEVRRERRGGKNK